MFVLRVCSEILYASYASLGRKDRRNLFGLWITFVGHPPANMGSKSVPADQINLRLILVSGKTKEFLFSPNESAGDIAQFVFDNWPHEWADEGVSKAEILRLIYQGRFLHGNVTLGALGLPTGKTCVMHLVPRENLPEPNSQDQRQKSKGGTSSCCSASCSIL